MTKDMQMLPSSFRAMEHVPRLIMLTHKRLAQVQFNGALFAKAQMFGVLFSLPPIRRSF